METTAAGKKITPEPRSLALFSKFEQKLNPKNNLTTDICCLKKNRLFSLPHISFILKYEPFFQNVSGYQGKDCTFKKW